MIKLLLNKLVCSKRGLLPVESPCIDGVRLLLEKSLLKERHLACMIVMKQKPVYEGRQTLLKPHQICHVKLLYSWPPKSIIRLWLDMGRDGGLGLLARWLSWRGKLRHRRGIWVIGYIPWLNDHNRRKLKGLRIFSRRLLDLGLGDEVQQSLIFPLNVLIKGV